MLFGQYQKAGISEFRALEFLARDIQSGTYITSIGLQSSGDVFYNLIVFR